MVGSRAQGTHPQVDTASLAVQHAGCSVAGRRRTNFPRHGDRFPQQPAIHLLNSFQTPATFELNSATSCAKIPAHLLHAVHVGLEHGVAVHLDQAALPLALAPPALLPERLANLLDVGRSGKNTRAA